MSNLNTTLSFSLFLKAQHFGVIVDNGKAYPVYGFFIRNTVAFLNKSEISNWQAVIDKSMDRQDHGNQNESKDTIQKTLQFEKKI